MAVYKRGYRRYSGPLTGRWTRFLVLPRYAWRRLYQQRLVLLLTILAFVWPVLCAAFIYLTNHAELLQGLDREFREFIQVDGRFFSIFMYVQAGFAVFLAALAGPGLIAPDLANNALPLYFSRPLTRWSYALARLLVLVGMLSVVTWIPGLILFWFQVGLAGGSWLRANWTLGLGMNVDPTVLQVRCPPTTLLTLVENAVRHGIDPSEEGGRIDVDIARRGDRCVVRVTDTGVGFDRSPGGLGTGLTALRERLHLIFGDAADLRMTTHDPCGAVVEIEMPAG